VILEAVFTANHLTDVEKQNITGGYTNKYSSKKQTMQNTAKKLAWFSRFLRHSVRKRDGLILQHFEAHMGQNDIGEKVLNKK